MVCIQQIQNSIILVNIYGLCCNSSYFYGPKFDFKISFEKKKRQTSLLFPKILIFSLDFPVRFCLYAKEIHHHLGKRVEDYHRKSLKFIYQPSFLFKISFFFNFHVQHLLKSNYFEPKDPNLLAYYAFTTNMICKSLKLLKIYVYAFINTWLEPKKISNFFENH